MRRIAVFATVLAVAAAAAGCTGSGNGKTSTGQLKVVAAENFWGNLVEQIGGSHVVVTSLVTNPNADPHEFTSNVADQLDVARAGLVIVNGAGYDGFMSKLLSASPSSHRSVVTLADFDSRQTFANGHNPHIWYDPEFIPIAIAQITDALVAADPAHKLAYLQGEARVGKAVSPLIYAVGRLRLKYRGTPVAYTERVPGYLLERLGLKVVTPAGFARSIEDGTDPSFADTAAMRNVITSHQATVLLYNSQAASPVTKQMQSLAISNGIPVVPVTETMPRGTTFESWQLAQVKALATALRTSSSGS